MTTTIETVVLGAAVLTNFLTLSMLWKVNGVCLIGQKEMVELKELLLKSKKDILAIERATKKLTKVVDGKATSRHKPVS